MTGNTAQEAYGELEKSYIARNPKSKDVHDRATQSMPGGNTRSVLYYSPWPLSIVRAEGAKLYDQDGHEYVDLLGEYTAGLYGHSEPIIVDAISEAAKRGLNFGSHHEDEEKLAALVKRRFNLDLLRFTNSGTEATLMALAAAKAYTGKKKIMVFDGAYHGGAFIFKNGKSNIINAPHEYLIAKYNDISSVQKLLKAAEHRGNVAAIIIEGMLGSGGAIPASRIFLEGIRKAANEAKAVLIFDEVMTSRLYEGGGIQSQLPAELRPDMTTLGKYIGGGMSFGAFGGRQDILELFDPRKANALAHAGTFNNNVLTMAAGRAGLERVFTPERARQLHLQGENLRKSLQEASQGTILKVTGLGSIMCFHFTRADIDKIKSPQDMSDDDHKLGDLFHLFLLERGYYIASRGFVALSLALSQKELDVFVEVVSTFLDRYKPLVSIGQLKSKM